MCEEEKCFRICWYFNCLWCTPVQVSLGHAVTSPKMTCEYQQTISHSTVKYTGALSETGHVITRSCS